MDEFNEEEEIIIPFVLTKKNGGVYDDEAFSAGWHLAALDARLYVSESIGAMVPPVVLRTKWKAMADLIAMSHQLMVEVQALSDPEYSIFTFASPEFFETKDS